MLCLLFFCDFYFFVTFRRQKTLGAGAGGFTPSQGGRKENIVQRRRFLFVFVFCFRVITLGRRNGWGLV